MGITISHSGYLRHVFRPRQLGVTVETVAMSLEAFSRRTGTRIDALAFRGFSGAGVVFPLSLRTGIPPINVRKQVEESHGMQIEGPEIEIETFVVVDDLMSSGKTVNTIIETLTREGLRCVGIFLYSYSSNLPAGEQVRTHFCGDTEYPVMWCGPEGYEL